MGKKYHLIKNWKFPYGNVTDKNKPIDPQYLRDVREMFESNGGNGWWWFVGCAVKSIPKRFRKTRGKY